MKRATASDLDSSFDLIIIGGGIYGAACAWEATSRGLSTLLVERSDFGGATSQNSARIAHCGMRYLQHADIKRLRESVRERCNLMRIAPHLVSNLPFLMPLQGHGIKGRETMAVYLKLYDLLSPERRRFADPDCVVPDSGVLSAKSAPLLWPEQDPAALSGLATWSEGQMHTERLLLAFLRSAAERGLVLANYTEATEILREGDRAVGVRVRDVLRGSEAEARGRFVLNATGPWLAKTLLRLDPKIRGEGIHASKAFSLVVPPLSDEHALSFTIPPMYEDQKAVIDKGGSIQFAIPWRGNSMIASLHLACDDDPDRVGISEQEIETYIDLINRGYPQARLQRADVLHVLWGIVPAAAPGSPEPLKHYQIFDHAKRDGVRNLLSLMGVKFTTARDVAEKTVNTIAQRLGVALPASISASTPLWGGDFESLAGLESDIRRDAPAGVVAAAGVRLANTYGSRYIDVLAHASRHPDGARSLPDTHVLEGEIHHAIRDEMALTLADVILRRTGLGTHQRPTLAALDACAEIMAAELGWDALRRAQEVKAVLDRYAHLPIA